VNDLGRRFEVRPARPCLHEGSAGDDPVGIDILDVVFRMEREFGIKIHRQEVVKLLSGNQPPDVSVGEFFEFVRSKGLSAGVLDEDMDANLIWPLFQSILEGATGTNADRIQKDLWLIRDVFDSW
jgi:hypothetical protein